MRAAALHLRSVPADSTVIEAQLRLVGQSLLQALHSVPTPDQIDPLDRITVHDIRWHVAEALRVNRVLRRQLEDRLAGSTTPPEGSSHSTFRDPPVVPVEYPQEEQRTP